MPHGVVYHRSPVRFWLGLLALWLLTGAGLAAWRGMWSLCLLAVPAAWSVRLIGHAIDGARPIEITLLRGAWQSLRGRGRRNQKNLPNVTRRRIRLKR